MYTVIKNKVYNTETARMIARYEHKTLTETLYRKQTGEYFMHFFDSAASDDDNRAGWKGKDKIAPYDFETARAWAELRLDKAQYEELFEGTVDESKIVVMTIKIDKASAAKLRKLQSETGETVSQLLEKAVAYL